MATQNEDLHVSDNTTQQVTPHHEERPDYSNVMNATQEPLIEQDEFQHGIVGVGVDNETNELLNLYEAYVKEKEAETEPTVVQGGTTFGSTEHSTPDSERVPHNEDEERNVFESEHQRRRISCDTVYSCEHLSTHSGKKPYGCDVCSKCFNRKSTLKKHLLIHADDKSY
ncbi:zinc finger protein 493-like [Galleria mellonella]|uniref:Zinc finger protein 493-like n=1 Tax=Galleria mellonella TaxID=7137 RepID=A0ABM3MRZ3_GALME|nr:zinc finger protein 493-like [Galleria mellonella]